MYSVVQLGPNSFLQPHSQKQKYVSWKEWKFWNIQDMSQKVTQDVQMKQKIDLDVHYQVHTKLEPTNANHKENILETKNITDKYKNKKELKPEP